MSVSLELDSLSLTEIIRLQDQLSAFLRRRFESTLALAFSDIVGSTAYFERFGDEAGGRLQQRHLDLLQQSLSGGDGRLVDQAGDGAFLCFSQIESAIHAVIRLQQLVWHDNATRPREQHLHVRNGVHWGSVLSDPTLVTGDAVNLCARITNAAGPGQILVTKAAFHELPTRIRLCCHTVAPVRAKGIVEPVEVMLLEWRESSHSPDTVLVEETRQTFAIPDQDVITFGRLSDIHGTRANDIVLELPDPQLTQQISRWHFELRKTPEGLVLLVRSSQATEVDGKRLSKGEQAAIHDGSIAKLAGVMTLRFLVRGERSGSSDETLYSKLNR